jgi:predicted ABC-type ATPase
VNAACWPTLAIAGTRSSSAEEFLGSYPYPYVSADRIAERLPGDSIKDVRLEAGRAFFREIRQRIAGRDSFIVESTLSGLTFRNQELLEQLPGLGGPLAPVL